MCLSCSIDLISNYADFFVFCGYCTAKPFDMLSKNTQATDPSGRKRVSDADVGVTGTASASELTTTAQKPMIEQVPIREDFPQCAIGNNWNLTA